MTKVDIRHLEIFKVDYNNKFKETYWDIDKELYITDKTQFIKSFERWYEIKPHLQKLNVRRSIYHGFSDRLSITDGARLLKGEHPYQVMFRSILDIPEDLFRYFDLDYLIKHDPLNKEAYLFADEYVYTDIEDMDEFIEGYRDNQPNYFDNDSWFNYCVAHLCQHMSYFEAEFGKILEPHLDWWIVYTDAPHGFAIGVNEEGHVDYIYDMSWFWYEQDQDIEDYIKSTEIKQLDEKEND